IWTDRVRYLLRRAARSELVADLISEFTTEQGPGRRLEVRRQGGLTAVAPPAGTMEGVHRLTDEKAKARAAESINSVLKSLPEGQRAMVIADIASRLSVVLPDRPPDDYAGLSWAELREMAASGIDVGSHSMTHSILTLESDQRVLYELRESRSKIE